jgi:hypothetical protein
METVTLGTPVDHDILTLRPRTMGFGNVLDDAIDIISRRFGLFVKLTCVTYLPWTLLLLAFQATFTREFTNAGIDLPRLLFVLFTVMLPLTVLYNLFIAPYTAGLFTYAASELYHGREPRVRDSMWYVFRHFLWVFLINIVYMVLMSAFPVLTIGIASALAVSSNFGAMVFAIMAGSGISLVACLIVGWLMFFTLPAVVVEKLGLIGGLERSLKLAQPHLLPILAAFIVFFFVWLSLGGVATIIPQPHVQAAANAIASGMISAFETVVTVVLYYSCRCRLENYDLVLLAREVQSGRPQSGDSNVFAGFTDNEERGA